MSISHSYAVFGVGRYGRAVALELVKSGADVIAEKPEDLLRMYEERQHD